MRWTSLLSFAILVVSFSSLSTLVGAQDTNILQVVSEFEQAHIPEDADITFAPQVLLEVSFPQASGQPALVSAGVQLQRDQLANPPQFGVKLPTPALRKRTSTTSTSPEHVPTFVVSMVDLDAPTPQNRSLAEVRHFLGGNFHLQNPNRFGVASITNSTPALSEFIQPTPPLGSDPHRYLFLLYDQPANFNENAPNFVNASNFIQFSISDFARQLGLGNPLGGTYMRVGPDPNAQV